MASFARGASEIIEAVANPLMRSYWGPTIGLIAAGALSFILRELVRNNERDTNLENRDDYFAQMRRKEEAEFLAKSQAKSETDN
jgi:hypothetical protein